MTKLQDTVRRQLEARLRRKRETMRKHAPGTPWHERARRDAEEIERRLREVG